MIRIFRYILAAAAAFSVAACAEKSPEDGPVLKFRPDGTFRILQFTDTHIVGDPMADTSYACMDSLIKWEKPDLVMLTGDIVYGQPGDSLFDEVMAFLEGKGVPFAFVFGNHEFQVGSDSVMLSEALRYGNCLARNDSFDGKPLSGNSTYDLQVLSSDGSRTACVIYAFDSHDESPYWKSYSKDYQYDFIKPDQVEWYCSRSRRYREANGGEPVKSLAFMHIPLCEVAEAAADSSAYGVSRLDVPADKGSFVGTFGERVCCSDINSGLFAAMKENGDVKAVFCGHDHDSDFSVMYKGIVLAYGRYSGCASVYFDLGMNGGRVIDLTEGSDEIRTYIRLRDGNIINSMTYNIK
jgi:3',5'-cyclic AMP phosphodiesterase CpdA